MIKLPKEQRQRVIVNAALDVLRNKGLMAVSFENVAPLTIDRISASTVKSVFKTRDALWAAVIEADDTGKAREEAAALGFHA